MAPINGYNILSYPQSLKILLKIKNIINKTIVVETKDSRWNKITLSTKECPTTKNAIRIGFWDSIRASKTEISR